MTVLGVMHQSWDRDPARQDSGPSHADGWMSCESRRRGQPAPGICRLGATRAKTVGQPLSQRCQDEANVSARDAQVNSASIRPAHNDLKRKDGDAEGVTAFLDVPLRTAGLTGRQGRRVEDSTQRRPAHRGVTEICAQSWGSPGQAIVC